MITDENILSVADCATTLRWAQTAEDIVWWTKLNLASEKLAIINGLVQGGKLTKKQAQKQIKLLLKDLAG